MGHIIGSLLNDIEGLILRKDLIFLSVVRSYLLYFLFNYPRIARAFLYSIMAAVPTMYLYLPFWVKALGGA